MLPSLPMPKSFPWPPRIPGAPKRPRADAVSALLRRPGLRIAELVRRAEEAGGCTARIRALVEAQFRPHLVHAHVAAKQLVVVVDTAAWATRWRYQAPELLRCIRAGAGFAGVESIRVRVAVSDPPRVRPASGAPRMSRTAAAFLQQVSDSTPDPELKATFARLSRRAHK
ncbi:MAG: DciA family protein [Gammaproteobacteria bacterium]